MKCIEIKSCLECPNLVKKEFAEDCDYCKLDDSIWIEDGCYVPRKCPLKDYSETRTQKCQNPPPPTKTNTNRFFLVAYRSANAYGFIDAVTENGNYLNGKKLLKNLESRINEDVVISNITEISEADHEQFIK